MIELAESRHLLLAEAIWTRYMPSRDMVASQGTAEQIAQFNSTGILPTQLIQYAQFGIILSGLVSIAAGILVRFAGRKAVETLLPPTVTGSVAMIIGLTLAGNALTDAAPAADATGITGSGWVWVVSLITLLSTVIYARYLKGFLAQLPLLLGAFTGCAAACILYLAGAGNLFRAMQDCFRLPSGQRPRRWAARSMRWSGRPVR